MATRPKNLLAIDTNAKTVKGQKIGFMTGIMYLAPAKLSGYEVCPKRSKGCTAACLNTAGRGAMTMVQEARVRKTHWYFEDREAFMAQLVQDIAALVRKAERAGLVPLVRLNGTSDISWERVRFGPAVPRPYPGPRVAENIMEMFPNVQFYDYTKVPKRALAHARGEMPGNYHLTFSLCEDNDDSAWDVLQNGGNVAAVFMAIPEGAKWSPSGRMVGCSDTHYETVVNGDLSDVRHLDGTGVVVALKAKGKARKDTSGFVREVI